jgi:dolichol-phosphate mannosyltransferase
MKLSIIIPAYNEEKTIKEIIKRVKDQGISNVQKEIIVVDDGSTDKTYEILKNIEEINLSRHAENKGKGRAIRTGLAKATGDFVIIQDADLELSPEDYPALLRPVLSGKTEVVYGSRILGKTGSEHSLLFYAGGRAVTLAANLIYGIKITDEPIGYKLFKTDLLKSLNLKCERFEFCPEVTAKIAKRNIKIYEVPVKYNPRTKGEGKKLGVRDGIQAVWTLIKYRFRE